MFDLLRQRDFGLLWLAGFISFTGKGAWSIALPLHVYQLTGSTLSTALAGFATILPRVLLGSVAGIFVDRWDRKRTMVVVDLVRVVVLLPVLIAPSNLPLLFIVAAIMGTLTLFYLPAEGALLPRLVPEKRLVTANALNALNNNLGMLTGPAMGAALYAWIGLGGTAAANAATFVISAALVSRIAANARPERDADPSISARAWAKVVADWRAGVHVVRRNTSLRVLFVSTLVVNIAEGIFLVLGLSPLVLDVLGGTAAQVGWVASAQAVGGLVAGVVVARIGDRMTRRWLYGGGVAGTGLADLMTANTRLFVSAGTPAVSMAMGWMVLAGPPVVASEAGRQAIIQTQTADAFRGRVFGALTSVQGLALVIGLALGGVLGDRVGIVEVLSAGALLRVLGGVIAVAFLPRDEWRELTDIGDLEQHVSLEPERSAAAST